MRPARKPWTPSINAAGLGMLPMGSVGSITMARGEVVATASEPSNSTPRPGADRQRPRDFDSNRGDLALGTGRRQGSRDRPTTTLGAVAADLEDVVPRSSSHCRQSEVEGGAVV